ncbi:MAG: glycerol-3-phosphate dehydrogenase, partial [Desulfuromonadales bacterium]|nr:glycerol-3-phosphate dehydrogenase [Desulfuromonadales bacterium]NIS43926.1 glycerol-3-phosphate dehydrogenase [Desulfuromonadales bacterium]
GPSRTAELPLPGGEPSDREELLAGLQVAGFSADRAEHLADRYGSRAEMFPALVNQQPDLLRPVAAGSAL